MAALDDLDEVIDQFDLAQTEFVRGNPEPMNKVFSHQEGVTLNNPSPLPRMDGMRLLGQWSAPHRSSEMARSLATRS